MRSITRLHDEGREAVPAHKKWHVVSGEVIPRCTASALGYHIDLNIGHCRNQVALFGCESVLGS